MSKQFPLCEYTEENELFCLSCPYSQCAKDLMDRQRELSTSNRKDKEEEEKKILDALLDVRWETYHKTHPNGMCEESFKTIERGKSLYAKSYRERKRKKR